MQSFLPAVLVAALAAAMLAPATLAAQAVPPVPPLPPLPDVAAVVARAAAAVNAALANPAVLTAASDAVASADYAVDAALAATPFAGQNAQANQITTVNNNGQLVVPLSHPSQPATLNISSLNSAITVTAYSGTQVLVSSQGDDGHAWRPRRTPPEAQGMRQLNSNAGVSAEEDNNIVTVHTSIMGGGQNVAIQVPVHTALKLRTISGAITVTGVTGDIDVEATNGRITLNQVSGSVVAHALNGHLQATIAQLDPSKPSAFSSFNGTIDVTLPANIHANLAMRSDRGNIYLDDGFTFQPTAHPASATTGKRDDNGMYKVKLDNTIYGTLNGGGPEIHFETFNGSIFVHKGR
ncbi:MAG: DUF4097 family beta strand repeat-containing protein [Terriglobales bacterium]